MAEAVSIEPNLIVANTGYDATYAFGLGLLSGASLAFVIAIDRALSALAGLSHWITFDG